MPKIRKSKVTVMHYGVPVEEGLASEVFKEAERKPKPWYCCPECSSSTTLYRAGTATQVCRRCGNVWKPKRPVPPETILNGKA